MTSCPETFRDEKCDAPSVRLTSSSERNQGLIQSWNRRRKTSAFSNNARFNAASNRLQPNFNRNCTTGNNKLSEYANTDTHPFADNNSRTNVGELGYFKGKPPITPVTRLGCYRQHISLKTRDRYGSTNSSYFRHQVSAKQNLRIATSSGKITMTS